MQLGANAAAERTPFHACTGCGARQRRLPTGGAANGTPLKIPTLPSGLDVPAIVPPVIWTCSGSAAARVLAGGIRSMPPVPSVIATRQRFCEICREW